ncbi:LysR family transcriptional regulator [Leminorella grimontii]|uniref:LysR family transcriptional regulator n=1 Tax=Leminorella grimontii TaxID=82981 RepID=A0AAV5MZK4_9GAMM|nr:LysR family transcriptional regulator [Leminorella grimontii]KFC95914.1 LysR family transcriptional regulator [Leminorella grimontii ATCC 33999 = DSM 5078]GKX54907.1 LysR family transcriptional regulator [Leminorella grimontii]GKX58326.1 LysR family transcriptional regulator [Leminorella grimontii]VFS58146.1 D-malate degradation protein R [Leminorella grimontii]
MLDELALFVSIVETGSLRAAAKKASIPAPTLTRRLQKLEQHLGCRLLHRSARRMTPTREGWQYYEQCRPLVHSLQQATAKLDVTLHQVSGLLRVLAPVDLANDNLAPAWMTFLAQYPEVRLELELDNYTQDLIGHGADVAIRVGAQPDSLLNMRRLGQAKEVLLVASPDYLAKREPLKSVDDLELHDLVVSSPLSTWTMQHSQSGEIVRWQPQGKFCVNGVYLALQAAQAGLGILFCPISLCHGQLRSGKLVRVLPEWQGAPRDIYAVWSQQRYVPARVRALIEHLADFCRQNPQLAI